MMKPVHSSAVPAKRRVRPAQGGGPRLNAQSGKEALRSLVALLRQSVRPAALLAAFWLGSGVPAHAASAGAEPEAAAEEAVELLSAEQLETLVAPVALYPDDLLAVVLPASTYPLQVVLAARFLESKKKDGNAKPDEDWDEAIIALLNYPEALDLLNEDLDWTWRLGEAVLAQEADVIAAVSVFRARAKAVGNLQSDSKQDVVAEDGAIRIKPTSPTRIHVPYYEPTEVVVRQSYRVYHYHPRAYPVYYYPYHSHHHFHDDLFWGVTSAFSIGWSSRQLHWHHYGLRGHPYFGYSYHQPFYYRRPHLYLTYREPKRRHRHEDSHWRPRDRRHGARPRHPRWRAADAAERGSAVTRNPDRRGDRQDRRGRRSTPDLRVATVELPAAEAMRSDAGASRPRADARRDGTRPRINAPVRVRTLPPGTGQRPQPLGAGGGGSAEQARRPWTGGAASRAVRPTQPDGTARQTQTSRTVRRPAETGLERTLPAQIRQRHGTQNRRSRPAASWGNEPPAAPAGNAPSRRQMPRTVNATPRRQASAANNAAPRPRMPSTISAIPRPQRPAAPARAQPSAPAAPRPNPSWQLPPGADASSPEALSKQVRRAPASTRAKPRRKDIDRQ